MFRHFCGVFSNKLIHLRKHIFCQLLLYTFSIYHKTDNDADYTSDDDWSNNPTHFAALSIWWGLARACWRRVFKVLADCIEYLGCIVSSSIRLIVNCKFRSWQESWGNLLFPPIVHDLSRALIKGWIGYLQIIQNSISTNFTSIPVWSAVFIKLVHVFQISWSTIFFPNIPLF